MNHELKSKNDSDSWFSKFPKIWFGGIVEFYEFF